MSAWRRSGPELAVAAAAMLAAVVAGFGLGGAAGAGLAATLVAAGWLVLIRAVTGAAAGRDGDQAAEPLTAPSDDQSSGIRGSVLPASSFAWNWRAAFQVKQATESLASYETQLRPRLEHLLAARLAERHSVNLYNDPHTAWRLLCRDGADGDLWFWVDPRRPVMTDRNLAGIGRRTLARLITGLERL